MENNGIKFLLNVLRLARSNFILQFVYIFPRLNLVSSVFMKSVIFHSSNRCHNGGEHFSPMPSRDFDNF